MPAATITLTVNGKSHAVTADDGQSLLKVLREHLNLTGTKYGCGEGQCGACSVLVDGVRVMSCSTTLADAQQKKITTIEGLADGEKLHPVQRAFLDAGAFQCGYCTAGMIVATVALLERISDPTDAQIIEAMNQNLCRCCGYVGILAAVRSAAKLMAEAKR